MTSHPIKAFVSGTRTAIRSAGMVRTICQVAGLGLLASTTAALGGGYVMPIVEFSPPAAVASTAGAPNYWLALLPLALLFLSGGGKRSGGGVQLAAPPLDHGGPCFCEGTLILLGDEWVPVETIRAGDLITTSKGVQTVLSVESWQPTEYRDRPCNVHGVKVSANHGVLVGGALVPAGDLSAHRDMIDGSRYIHILVRDHSWLSAKAGPDGTIVMAESLFMTKDLLLSKTFPDLAAHHAQQPAAAKAMMAA